MNVTLWLSDKIQIPHDSLSRFAQQMFNRITVGEVRYGAPGREKGYMSKMEREVKAYRRTGNREHLINVANFAWLESEWPEHAHHHFDAGVGSVHRARAAIPARPDAPNAEAPGKGAGKEEAL